jgi:uncharacterized protein (TIGR00369 family)
MPVSSEHFHAAGALHGAVCFKALDDAAFFAVNSVVEDVFVLTLSFTVHFLEPVRDGHIEARGELLDASKRIFFAESELLDASERLIGRGTGVFVKSRVPLDEDIGYR